MYSGSKGGPSRTLSTMSLSVRPVRALKAISRSHSFTGVNTYDKSRPLSVYTTPGLRRKPSKASRMFTMSSNPPPRVPQPERTDEVYEALKKGLQSYLQVHQMDLDSLSREMRTSKRNSRLGFLYELDKQVKVTERLIRRLEFHLSKVEELYEAYCLQRRLRDGANKMVKAFLASPSSKEARESLAEANKGYKEYTENMCVLETDLENHLGEFHIKMKGLAGFARLCAGDQYEIFMRYGRQRWKLRGKIEVNSGQVWDSDEMVFQPLINEFLSVKVTELKSLANHVVVGSVSCETKDLFAALPQTVAVDINDLGTIKLNLEVTWNPFDKEEQVSLSSSVNKAPSVTKRFSTIFNQSPPDTPSLREQAFYNMLRRHEEMENGRAWSNSSESSDDSSSPQLPASMKTIQKAPQEDTTPKASRTPDLQSVKRRKSSLQSNLSLCTEDSAPVTSSSSHNISIISEDPDSKSPAEGSRPEDSRTLTVTTKSDPKEDPTPIAALDGSLKSRNFSRSLSLISEGSADGVALLDKPFCEAIPETSTTSGTDITDVKEDVSNTTSELPENKPNNETTDETSVTPELSECSLPAASTTSNDPSEMSSESDVTYRAHWVSVEEDTTEAVAADVLSNEGAESVDSELALALGEALGALVSSFDDYRGQFPELQLLEQELKLLQTTLECGRYSRSSSLVSLSVETALGSFDFLNMSDCEEEEGERRSNNERFLQKKGWDSPSSLSAPLTTGCKSLDQCLEAHLKYCSAQLLCLGIFGPLRCREMYALDRLLREAQVFKMIRRVVKKNPKCFKQPNEVIPQLGPIQGAVSLWQQCVQQGCLYIVSVDAFQRALSDVYSSVLPERMSSMVDTVFRSLAEQVLDQKLPQRDSNKEAVMVTLFQWWNYLEASGVTDLETYISELAEEVWLVQNLASLDQDVIVKVLRNPVKCSLKKQGIHAVAKLLKDPRGKVSASASSVLRGLASQPRPREQALVNCLELLEDENVATRICGCKALACLKAKESIEQLVYLCQTDKDDVRDAVKQCLLVLGEEGKMAIRHIETSQDSIPRLFAPGSMTSTAF
ncbi:rho family-interacting cell polarization regulator 1 isoform X2 [Boleophthalmus pectinirostris]|uniref:rho family-interacting cell polarization regulator 1 isoform X2 n=1 Tax=Boleophthalmus pectinirostris TaxID=150288 RepID=UPI00242C1457|nr:rho family-interacting cell polarization regulator 1 isoform X2 [Boleophthalmus pectinirostris]